MAENKEENSEMAVNSQNTNVEKSSLDNGNMKNLKLNLDPSKASGSENSNITTGTYTAEEEEDDAVGARIDYGATLKSAYDNMDQVLGKEGVESLGKEAHKLAEDQKILMDNMNRLQEMMPQMNDLLNNMGGIDKMLGQVQGVLSNKDIMNNVGNILSTNGGNEITKNLGNTDFLKNIGSMLGKVGGNLEGGPVDLKNMQSGPANIKTE